MKPKQQNDYTNWPPIWPHPYYFKGTPGTKVSVDAAKFYFIVDNPSEDIQNALYRYSLLMFPHKVDSFRKDDDPTSSVTHC